MQVVRIGHVAPLSGSLANLGNDNQRGAQLRIEELNANAPRIAGKSVRFELVSEDDRANPRTALVVAQRLVDAKVVAVVGHLNSGMSVLGRYAVQTLGAKRVAVVDDRTA